VNLVLTETVNLAGRNKDFQALVDVETPQRSLRVLTPSPIKLSVEVGEKREFKHLENVPVTWDGQTPVGRLVTKTVEVGLYGPQSLVESLQAKDLRAEVKTITWENGLGVAQPTVILPDGADKRIVVRKIFPKEVKLKK